MPVTHSEKLRPPGIPLIPAIAQEFLKICAQQQGVEQSLTELIDKYPQFFNRLLNIINNDYFAIPVKVESIYQAIQQIGQERISQALLLQAVYGTFNQYRIHGLDMPAFWQDSLRRAVSARKMGELIGLDESRCFTAGFMQDIGLLILFLEQPAKGALWQEFRKREPEARLSMEKNIFNQQHHHKLQDFFASWNILDELQSQLIAHHDCINADFPILDEHLCKVLHFSDWMSAVYIADDKGYVINRCRKLLEDDFAMQPHRAEELLAAIPHEVNLSAAALDIKVAEHISFSQVLYEANLRLNEDNVNFQQLTQRLEQAIFERDKLAAEINRELNLAREIQQSLLPATKADNFPVNGINLSAKILSGDFYDFFELENGHIYFNLGDVSGKGMNAALLMAKTCSLFRCLGKRIFQPGELLYEINNELCETSVHGMFVTLVAGLYQPENGQIKLANAGNPPALLFTESGICREYAATAPPLGVISKTQYTEYDINLNNGSLYIYSDGVTEGYIENDSELGLSGLFRLIAGMDKKLSARHKLKIIIDKVSHSTKPLRDDVTLLLLESAQIK